MTAPFWQDDQVTLYLGDCVNVLAELPDSSVDAVVTDPPYGLGFMGKDWDRPGSAARGRKSDEALAANPYGRARAEYSGASYTKDPLPVLREFQAWCELWARECLRVLKPGGHLLAFGGTRTYHRLGCAIEDAGFEIRDSLHWLYGSGFPKSLDVSKAIDKAAGAEREVVGTKRTRLPGGTTFAQDAWSKSARAAGDVDITAPGTVDAARWAGWGTALKPAHEPIIFARKPLDGTVAANVLEYGTGALNVDACRVEASGRPHVVPDRRSGNQVYGDGLQGSRGVGKTDEGRWPSNVVLTHSASCERVGERAVRSNSHHPASRGQGGLSTTGHAGQDGLDERRPGVEHVEVWVCAPDCPVAELDRQSGVTRSGQPGVRQASGADRLGNTSAAYGAESRPAGTPVIAHGDEGGASRFFPVFRYDAKADADERPRLADGTAHPTVKPVSLMEWLVRLVTPPGGVVLDPFGGSGTTAEACIIHGFRCVLVEKDPAYAELIRTRLRKPIQVDLFGGAA